MTRRGPVFWLLFVIALSGLASAGRILWKRASYEKANKTVQIVLDLPSLAAAIPPGEDYGAVINRLGELGINTFGVYEFKLKELRPTGITAEKISPESGAPGEKAAGIPGSNFELSLNAPWLTSAAPPYVEAYFGAGACEKEGKHCFVPDLGSNLDDMTFGLHASGIKGVVSPRFFNTKFEKEASIKLKISELAKLGSPSVIIFDGDSALGYPDMLDITASEIQKYPGWSLGLVDMVKQDGTAALARRLPGKVIPVHSIPELELPKNPPPIALSRFNRAVRERGIRVLYVRLYTSSLGKSPDENLKLNIEYLEKLVGELKADGYKIGKAEPLKPFIVSKALRALCLAGAVAFVGLLCGAAFGFPQWLSLLCSIAAFGAAMALPASGGLYRYLVKLVVLGDASLVPVLSVTLLYLMGRWHVTTRFKPGVGEATVRWAATCALTLAGAAFVAAALSQRDYFLRLDTFSGVKIAFILPVLLIIPFYVIRTGERLGDFFRNPVKYAEIAVGIVLLGVIAVYILRSGNDASSAVSGSESALRAKLEAIFYARPRFKEFLIGYPALLLVGLIPLRRKRYIGLLLLLFGVIGQVSLLNTFCHLHTPIMFSYLRCIIGVILGLVIGLSLRVSGTVLAWFYYKYIAHRL
ncbi:MAG TPA: DUF5693 family protein [bacterium]|nr:DUF5693 family protein [bacterium]